TSPLPAVLPAVLPVVPPVVQRWPIVVEPPCSSTLSRCAHLSRHPSDDALLDLLLSSSRPVASPARRRWRLPITIALVVAAAFLSCGPLANRLLLYPPSGERTLGGERVMIADTGGAIETIRAKNRAAAASGATAIVLRFYGNADRADEWPSHD